ncbi:MAG: RNA methyltransferase [Bacteroidales bacterium]|nr:RNA methyltransferase [Bacteroidales bacterium]
MLTNNEIKAIRSLKDRKNREEQGLFVVEGEKMVREAQASGYEIKAIYRSEDIGETAMSRISLLTSPSPILAVVRIPRSGKAVPDGSLCLGLDSVRDPGNMGTIIRLADWFGVRKIFCTRDSVDIYNPKVVQATMGAIFRVEVTYCDLAGLCHDFRTKGLSVYGTFLDGETIYAGKLSDEGIVVMGNESNGISPEVEAEVDRRLFIPSFGNSLAESLNVAVATSVTLSEFKRRTL